METLAQGAEVRSPGQVLAAERERQGLACADVAQRLHMSAWQVEALEQGDYARLPKGTFLRGFVRNYARLLHVDSTPLVPLLPTTARPESSVGASIEPPSEKIRFEPMGPRARPVMKAAVISLLALIVAVAVMYWWLYVKDTAAALEARKPAAAPAKPASGAPQQVAVAPVPPAEVPPPVEAPREELKPEPAPPEPVKAEPPKVASPRVEPPKAAPPKTEPPKAAAAKAEPPKADAPGAAAPVAGERRIALRFKGDSWVEVRDARGRVLMSKLNTAGSTAEVSGRAPFTVIVGNAPEVQMTLDDRPFDLQPQTRVGVARVTVQ
jgi:cytoskeleton protein RodZ